MVTQKSLLHTSSLIFRELTISPLLVAKWLLWCRISHLMPNCPKQKGISPHSPLLLTRGNLPKSSSKISHRSFWPEPDHMTTETPSTRKGEQNCQDWLIQVMKLSPPKSGIYWPGRSQGARSPKSLARSGLCGYWEGLSGKQKPSTNEYFQK